MEIPWELVKWSSAILTSSFASGLYTHWRFRRENRIRFFKMVIADAGNVSAVPTDYQGTHYESVRYVTYHLHNRSGKDFTALVLGLGFKCGKLVQVTTESEIFGESAATKAIENDTSVTIAIPVFNRQDVLIIRVEIANCEGADLGWKWVKNHPGIQIEMEYPRGMVAGHPQGNQTSLLRLKKTSLVHRLRRTIASWVHPGD